MLSLPRFGIRVDLDRPAQEFSGVDLFEIVPEDWIGKNAKTVLLLEHLQMLGTVWGHTLSLSLGSDRNPDLLFEADIRNFIRDHQIKKISDHLSFSSDEEGYFYTNLSLPRKKISVDHYVDRIKKLRDFFDCEIDLENVAIFHPMSHDMPEVEFILEIVQKAQTQWVLDLDALSINSFHSQENVLQWIKEIPEGTISYMHLGGGLELCRALDLPISSKELQKRSLSLMFEVLKNKKDIPVIIEGVLPLSFWKKTCSNFLEEKKDVLEESF